MMYPKIGQNSGGFDLTFPTSTDIPGLLEQGLVLPLDLSLIPNVTNLAAEWLHPAYDPDHTHSMPYMWWTTGFAYDSDKIDEEPTSWAALWDERFAKHIMMLDDQREVFAAALIRQGKSINTVDDAELDAALALLKEQRPLVRKYSDDPIGDMKSGNMWLGHDWSGDIWAVQATPSMTFVLPEEGAVRGSDAAVSCRAPRTRSPPTCSSTICSTPRSAPPTRTPSTTWVPMPRPRSSSTPTSWPIRRSTPIRPRSRWPGAARPRCRPGEVRLSLPRAERGLCVAASGRAARAAGARLVGALLPRPAGHHRRRQPGRPRSLREDPARLASLDNYVAALDPMFLSPVWNSLRYAADRDPLSRSSATPWRTGSRATADGTRRCSSSWSCCRSGRATSSGPTPG